MSISHEMVAQLRDELQALPPRPRQVLTARDVVTDLAVDIQAARSAGYSLSDIAGQLGQRGVTISANTLGSYLRAISHQETEESRNRRRRRGKG